MNKAGQGSMLRQRRLSAPLSYVEHKRFVGCVGGVSSYGTEKGMWVVVHINVFDREASRPEEGRVGGQACRYSHSEWSEERRGLAGPPLSNLRVRTRQTGTWVHGYAGTCPPCTSRKYLNRKSGPLTGLFPWVDTQPLMGGDLWRSWDSQGRKIPETPQRLAETRGTDCTYRTLRALMRTFPSAPLVIPVQYKHKLHIQRSVL